MNFPHKGPVTREMFSIDYVIMDVALTERIYEFGVLRDIVLRASAPRGLGAWFYNRRELYSAAGHIFVAFIIYCEHDFSSIQLA